MLKQSGLRMKTMQRVTTCKHSPYLFVRVIQLRCASRATGNGDSDAESIQPLTERKKSKAKRAISSEPESDGGKSLTSSV